MCSKRNVPERCCFPATNTNFKFSQEKNHQIKQDELFWFLKQVGQIKIWLWKNCGRGRIFAMVFRSTEDWTKYLRGNKTTSDSWRQGLKSLTNPKGNTSRKNEIWRQTDDATESRVRTRESLSRTTGGQPKRADPKRGSEGRKKGSGGWVFLFVDPGRKQNARPGGCAKPHCLELCLGVCPWRCENELTKTKSSRLISHGPNILQD